MSVITSIVLNFALTLFSGIALAQEPTSRAGGVALLPGGGIIPACLRDPQESATIGISCLTDSITHFTSLVLFLVAVGSFVYLLYGAFLYASAFGDENKVSQGKKTITYALIGVLIAVLSRIAVEALRQLLGAN